MNIVQGAVRAVTLTADATTAAAGAVGGAAINGVIGGIRGTAAGIRSGSSDGSHSSAAAALTLAAVGTAGLVEWPIVLAVGGTALVVHQLSQQAGRNASDATTTTTTTQRAAARPVKAKPANATKAAKRTPSRSRRTSTK
jgi:hypothetical protein